VTPKQKIWGDERSRQAHLDKFIEQHDTANYGYRKIAAGEKTEQVVRHFNSVARQYDFMNTLLSFGIHYLWKRAAVKLLALKPGDRVLDVCGGTGDLSILAVRAVGEEGQVALYDINRAMMEAGRCKNTNAAARRLVQFVQGNAEQIAFPDETFDAVMVGFGIRNVTHMEQGFREMHRVLKKGGKMMCLESSKPTNPVFRWFYDRYSLHVMPLLGQVLAGTRQAYTHLPESIRMFPLPDELTVVLRRIGFADVTYRRLTNGIAVVHLACRI
jgi:demethylmenaquinone methyltransferase/2-methoxy-6-polyprenyl-1,4-benzoquinol methylase